MKFSLVFLAVLGVATAASIPESKSLARGLAEDLKDFEALIPGDKILNILIEYLVGDEEFQSVITYFTSDSFKEFVLYIQAIPEYHEFLNYSQSNGLDIYKWVDLINEILELDPVPRPMISRHASTRTGGLAGLVDEILALIPRKELRALYEEKLQTSPAFAEFAEYVAHGPFQRMVEKVKVHPEYVKIFETAESMGVPAKKLIDLLHTLLGIF